MYEFYRFENEGQYNKTAKDLINFAIIIVNCIKIYLPIQSLVMSYRIFTFFYLFFLISTNSRAQKPFTEGVVVYNIKLESADHNEYKGVYTFTFKGPHIKKELKLENGFSDIVIIDCGMNTVYSLQNRDGKKYSIQLSMADMLKRQEPFIGYTIKNEIRNEKKIAGCVVYKGKVNYKNGSSAEIYYSKDWYPSQPITFERFPDTKFMPMHYAYTDEHGIDMEFDAAKVELSPVENAVFRIPADYKVISYDEYKQMSK